LREVGFIAFQGNLTPFECRRLKSGLVMQSLPTQTHCKRYRQEYPLVVAGDIL
jgi:hypothetical protein